MELDLRSELKVYDDSVYWEFSSDVLRIMKNIIKIDLDNYEPEMILKNLDNSVETVESPDGTKTHRFEMSTSFDERLYYLVKALLEEKDPNGFLLFLTWPGIMF